MKPALLFLLDANYLTGFKTLLYSLWQRRTLLHLPIVVLSDDPEVLADPFVSKMADVKHCFSPAELELLKTISPEGARTPKSYRTFLKLLAFADYGFDKHLFLDTDLLCFNSAESLIYDYNSCEIAAAPTIDLRRLKNEDVPDEVRMDLHRKVFWSDKPAFEHFSFNSGVMVINKPVLGTQFVHELVAFGKSTGFSHDQDLLITFSKQFGYPQLQRLPQRYNVTKPFYQLYGSEQFELDQRFLVFHHYTHKKPWEKGWNSEWNGREKNSLFLNKLWQRFRKGSAEWITAIEKAQGGKWDVLKERF